MQVSVEEVSSLERRITVSVDEKKIDEAVEKELKNLARRVNIKGFRAGKVPLNVVRQRYGEGVRNQVLADVMQASFYEAINQEKLHPAGAPNFEPKSTAAGAGFEFSATFEVYPEISVADLTKLQIESPQTEITDADLDTMLETIQKQHMGWQVAQRATQQGDKVTIDFTGTIEGEIFEGGSGTDMTVEIGKGRLIAGFEDGLLGLSVGDEKTLDLNFPEGYHKQELAGKPVQFAVKVRQVEEPVLPPVDSELAKKLGIEDGDVDKLRSEVRANMQRELDAAVENLRKKNVMDKLLEAHKVEVPKALVENESKHLAEQMAANLEQQGIPRSQGMLQPSLFEKEATRRVSLGLIMAEIVKQQGIKADEAAVRQRVEKIAEPYEHSDQVVKWYYGDKRRLAEVESLVIEEQVVKWVIEQAAIKHKPMSFKEIMYPEKKA